MRYPDIQTASIENADKRLAEPQDFVVNAIADYENGLTTGFKDGAEWMLQKAMAVCFDFFKGNPTFLRIMYATEIAHTLLIPFTDDNSLHNILHKKSLESLATEDDIQTVISNLRDFYDNLYKTEQL